MMKYLDVLYEEMVQHAAVSVVTQIQICSSNNNVVYVSVYISYFKLQVLVDIYSFTVAKQAL